MFASSTVWEALADNAASLVAAANERKLTIITAESCTAGRLTTLLTDAPHAGEAVQGGFVVYSDAAKASLGVPLEILDKYGAVSAEVARQMADAALIRSGADVSVAITGVAGPNKDKDGNEVGLVFIATARRGLIGQTKKKRFGSLERNAFLSNTLDVALRMTREQVERA